MITLSTAKRFGGSLSIDGDWRGVDFAGEARRMQLQRFDFSVAKHGGHGPPVHQLHAFLQHVMQVFRRGRHFLAVAFDRDHGHFDGALTERFARAVDRGVSAADDGDARTELHFGRAHADVAKEGKPENHAGFVLALGSRAVGLGKAHGKHGGVVILFQIVQRDVFADFDVGLDLNAEFDEAFDLAIEHRLRENPVRNAAAIQSACFRRLLQNRHLVPEARQLVRGAVAGGT